MAELKGEALGDVMEAAGLHFNTVYIVKRVRDSRRRGVVVLLTPVDACGAWSVWSVERRAWSVERASATSGSW